MEDTVLEEALRISNEIIWVISGDPDGVTNVYASEENRIRYGITSLQSTSSFWQNFIHPDETDKVLDGYQNAIYNKDITALELQYAFLFPDGKRSNCRNSIRFSRDSNGGVVRITGVWKEIKKHSHKASRNDLDQLNRQLLENLKESSEREIIFNQAQELAKIGSWEFDIETGMMTWSSEMYNIFEIDRAFPINNFHKLSELFSDECRLEIQDLFSPPHIYFKKELPIDITVQLKPIGENPAKWVRITANPMKRENQVRRVIGVTYDITYFKRAEEILRQSEEKFSKAFDLTPALMLITRESDGALLDANSKLKEISGFSRDEVIGTDILRKHVWVYPEQRDKYFEQLWDKGTHSAECTMRKKDGTIFYCLISSQRIVLSDVEYFLIMVQDMTEKKMTEDRIRKNEARLHATINNTDLMVWSVDLNYNIESMNNVFSEVSRKILGEIAYVGLNILELAERTMGKENANTWKELYNRSFSGEIVGIEFELRGRSLFSRIYPIISAGRVIGASVYARDITEQKESEDKIRHSEANLAAIINNTSLFIWSVDREYRLITFNSQIREFARERFNIELKIGYKVLEGAIRSPLIDELEKRWKEKYNRVFKGEIVRVRESHHGTIFDYSLSPILEAGNITGAAVFVEDVTEKVQKDYELNEANKKIAEFKLMALRSVMNPHFVFNALNSIQSFIMESDQANALSYLSKFSKLVRSILQNAVRNKIKLSEELEQLKNYVNLEQVRFDRGFNFVLQVDPTLEQEDPEIPTLLIQPYVENAIIHGLYNKDTAGTLKIIIDKGDDAVLITIEDDGVGRDAAKEIRKNTLPGHQSMGTILTEERLKLINEDTAISVKITDLYEAGKPAGTRVNIGVRV